MAGPGHPAANAPARADGACWPGCPGPSWAVAPAPGAAVRCPAAHAAVRWGLLPSGP